MKTEFMSNLISRPDFLMSQKHGTLSSWCVCTCVCVCSMNEVIISCFGHTAAVATTLRSSEGRAAPDPSPSGGPGNSHDFLLPRERLRFLGLDCRCEGFWVTDWTSWSMISSVASSWEPFPSSLSGDGISLPRPGVRAESEPGPDPQQAGSDWCQTGELLKELSYCGSLWSASVLPAARSDWDHWSGSASCSGALPPGLSRPVLPGRRGTGCPTEAPPLKTSPSEMREGKEVRSS